MTVEACYLETRQAITKEIDKTVKIHEAFRDVENKNGSCGK